ncbi:COP9 signalosome complex subunit, putative [Pediculus humanus corporis]|uniref:COP9 signalosome complex subunit 3 n=1 Tax=Pediculus humanus subsp. corporis TaxID=121224 RepID=E0VSQ7_PEDHC|nr:COP9 signalosome complex subunit, putative [Pediculus humanus corporis]EEB16413.1 COP9 signalosome complex subunit, putative [Pediculus humanus corporis]
MASALEQFVNNVRSLSASGSYRELSDLISKSSEVLVSNSQHLDNVLETLDLQQHSLGVLAVLCVKLSLQSQSPEEQEAVLSQVADFINHCNGDQIRLAPDNFADLCHLYTQTLTNLKMPIRGIELMKKAIQKIQLNDAQLTPIHADLCQLCLLAKCFKTALPFLDTDITSISQEGPQFDTKYFLLYYYYGGMIYTALKKYSQALYLFEVAVTTPAVAVSHIMLEAYKKYILVSLILQGKITPLPKYTSHVVGRFMKHLSQPYHELAAACQSNQSEEARNIVIKNQFIFQKDNNIGLTKQVLASLYKNNIQRLTKTFLTLSLADVASRVQLSSPAEAEKYILNMIEDGEIFATVNQKDGMVVFHDDPEKYNSPYMLKILEEQVTACMELDKKIQQMEEEIMVNPRFVKKSCGSQDEDLQGTKMSTYSM